jgi:DNA/RNA-binding domain of Phe-tRNA-synthetase-like protein
MLFVGMTMSACDRSQRVDTIHSTLIAVNAARDGFTAWDRQHQQTLVAAAVTRETAEQSVSSYRDGRRHVVDGFEVTYRALAVAATQTDDVSLSAALTTATELIDKISDMIGGK